VLEKVKKNETQNEKKLPNGPVSDDIKMLGRTPVFLSLGTMWTFIFSSTFQFDGLIKTLNC